MQKATEYGLRIEECGGVDRWAEEAVVVLPFFESEWPADETMVMQTRILNGSGSVVVMDNTVESRWPDGSVRLARCRMRVDISRQSRIELTPVIGPTDSGRGTLQEHKAIDISPLFDAVTLTADSNGTTSVIKTSFADGERWENAAPQMEGVEVRTTASRLTAGALFTFRVLNTRREPVVIDRLRLSLDPAAVLQTQAYDLEMGNRSTRIPASKKPRYLQLSMRGELSHGCETDIVQYPLGGECRQNTLWLRAFVPDPSSRPASGGVTAAVRNFGENFPCGCGIESGTLFFDLRPKEAEPLVLEQGVSKTHQFGVVLDEGGDRAGGEYAVAHIHLPAAPSVNPARLEVLGCFPSLAPYEPGKYSKLEAWTKWAMANRPRSYGCFDFGDEPNFSYMARSAEKDGMFSLNNEYDVPLILLTEYCRTSERMWYEDGRAAVLHMMDIDTATVSDDPNSAGGQYAHAIGHRGRTPAPDHEWLEGLLLWYLLSGDFQAHEAARALADRMVRLAEQGTFDSVGMTSRRYGWPLVALCSYYAFSKEKPYLTAAERIVQGMARVEREAGGLRSPYWGTPYWSLDTFMVGIAASGLCRYHRVTGDDACARMIVRSCDAIMSMLSPEGIFYYKEYPLVRLPEPLAGIICCDALAYGYELTRNEAYLVASAKNIEALLDMTRVGAMIHWNAEERVDVPPGAYMGPRMEGLTGQYIGTVHRGMWPFIATAERHRFFESRDNPFCSVFDRT